MITCHNSIQQGQVEYISNRKLGHRRFNQWTNDEPPSQPILVICKLQHSELFQQILNKNTANITQ